MASKITTPEGLREAIDVLSADLSVLAVADAETLADKIRIAAPKALVGFPVDDLEDLEVSVIALRNRLRRKWKRQRSNSAWSTGVGVLCGAAASALGKFATVPPSAVVALVVIGALLGLLGMISLMNVTDWRDDVAKPVGDVADLITKSLASSAAPAPAYRSPSQTGESTRTRATPTIEADSESQDPSEGIEEQRKRR